ncbi:hypothetical protein [Nocardia testacea]|uniref:hypothetical protein n=1 Tax=Nocardia testacea TaxID=248551 RepID=UPI0002E6AA1C|nr:hypothetical protein [Nocardia testacea]
MITIAPGSGTCGTDAGYHRHKRRREPSCQLCRDAHADAIRDARHGRRDGAPGQIRVDALLFASMYLETTPARQVDAENALGRKAIDRLVAALDRLAS